MRRTLAMLALLQACAVAADAQQQRVAEIQIAPRYLRMRVDAVAPLVATAYDADGIPVNVEFEWASSNINVADVGPDGMVRGVAPGAAVVTATAGTGAARRVGQVSVFVARAGQVIVMPVPPTHVAPPVPGAPASPPSPPTGTWVRPPPVPRTNVDSIIRASIDCTDPFMNAVNPARACYDERPQLRVDASRLVLPPGTKGACPPGTTRGHVGMLVQVAEGGDVTEVRIYAPTGCPETDAAAEAAARSLTFEPATREGRPTRSWIRIQLRTGP